MTTGSVDAHAGETLRPDQGVITSAGRDQTRHHRRTAPNADRGHLIADFARSAPRPGASVVVIGDPDELHPLDEGERHPRPSRIVPFLHHQVVRFGER